MDRTGQSASSVVELAQYFRQMGARYDSWHAVYIHRGAYASAASQDEVTNVDLQGLGRSKFLSSFFGMASH